MAYSDLFSCVLLMPLITCLCVHGLNKGQKLNLYRGKILNWEEGNEVLEIFVKTFLFRARFGGADILMSSYMMPRFKIM